MITSLLDPALFLPDVATWRAEETRDEFLARLLAHLAMLDALGSVHVFWADELEARLWSDPPLAPWMEDTAYRVPLVPVMYKKWRGLRTLTLELPDDESTLEPALQCVCPVTGVLFLRLLEGAFEYRPPICVGGTNAAIGALSATSARSGDSYSPRLVKTARDWLQIAEIEATCWPTGRGDSAALRKCVQLVQQRDFPESRLLLEYDFAPRFLADIQRAPDRQALVEALVRRLTLPQLGAGADPRLQDERLRDGMRRFRVRGAQRVHYAVGESGALQFLRYYTESEHDDGV